MNSPHPPYATTAAEGLPRRAFTVADVERMVETCLTTYIYREPGAQGYGIIRDYRPDERLIPLASARTGRHPRQARSEIRLGQTGDSLSNPGSSGPIFV